MDLFRDVSWESDLKLTPFAIAIIYLFLGTSWILFSDILVFERLGQARAMTFAQIVKEGFFIGVSTLLVFALIKIHQENLLNSRKEIEDARQRVDVMSRVFRHNIKNNLNSVLIYSEMAKKHAENQETKKDLDKSIDIINNMLGFSEHVSRLQGVIDRGGTNKKKNIDVVKVVERCSRSVNKNFPKAKISVNSPKSLDVLGNESIALALEEAIRNGIEHNDLEPKVKKIQIDIYEDPDSDYSIVEISDNGPGIPEEELEPIKKGRESRLKHGSSIGLWSIYWIIKDLGGEIKFQDRDNDRGTKIKIKLQKPKKNNKKIKK